MASTAANNRPLAAIYAQALYAAAAQAQVNDQVGSELLGLLDIIRRAPKVAVFLETPTVSFKNKRTVIEKTFANFSRITQNLLLVLVQRNRTTALPLIAEEYQAVTDRKAGLARVQVASARALEPAERGRLTSILAAKFNAQVVLSESVKPALLGGVVVTHEDKRWDGSVLSELNALVRRLGETQTQTGKWTA